MTGRDPIDSPSPASECGMRTHRGRLGPDAYGGLVVGASWAAVLGGLLFVAVGWALDDSMLATASLLSIPLGTIVLADHYASRAERHPVVRAGSQPGVVVVRYRPLRLLVLLLGLSLIGAVLVVFGWGQSKREAAVYGIALCVIVLVLAVIAILVRRSASLVLSPTALTVRLPRSGGEFAWDSIIGIGVAQEPHGDVITISCAETSSSQRSRRSRGEPALIPVDCWGVDTVGLFDALRRLDGDPALRDNLTPAMVTALLTHRPETPVAG